MGVGSQRRELDANYQDQALQKISVRFPKLKLISNLGLAQLIELHQRNEFSKLQKLIEKYGCCFGCHPSQSATGSDSIGRHTTIFRWLRSVEGLENDFSRSSGSERNGIGHE